MKEGRGSPQSLRDYPWRKRGEQDRYRGQARELQGPGDVFPNVSDGTQVFTQQ